MTDSQKTPQEIAQEIINAHNGFVSDLKESFANRIQAERDRATELQEVLKRRNFTIQTAWVLLNERDKQIVGLREQLRTAEEAWKVGQEKISNLEDCFRSIKQIAEENRAETGAVARAAICQIEMRLALLQPSAPIPPPIPPSDNVICGEFQPTPPQSVQAEDGGK